MYKDLKSEAVAVAAACMRVINYKLSDSSIMVLCAEHPCTYVQVLSWGRNSEGQLGSGAAQHACVLCMKFVCLVRDWSSVD